MYRAHSVWGLLALACFPLASTSGQGMAAPAPDPVLRGPGPGNEAVQAVPLPELGRVVHDVRRVQADGFVVREGRGEAGETVDVDALRRLDRALALERRGKLAPTLFERAAALPAGERIEVAFWLVEPPAGRAGPDYSAAVRGLEPGAVPDAVREARRGTLQAARERLAGGNAAFARSVRERGGEVVLVAGAWPVVIARVTGDELRELAREPAVDEAYLSQPEWYPEGDQAQGTMRTPTAFQDGASTAAGFVRVMVNDTAHPQLDNPWLPPIVTLNPGATSGFHATPVAGNIAGTHPLYGAAARHLPELYSVAGTGDASAPGVWDLAIQAGVDFGNCSWWNGLKGQIEFLDRFFDYTVRQYGVMMFKSAGNQGGTATPLVTTPGNGYNVIATGSFSDENDLQWEGDAMSWSSSWGNPAEGHEKPELAAPGTCVTTAATVPGGLLYCWGGTSSASPLTCGVGALTASEDPVLLSQMTTVKAALMASAWQNVEGDPVLSDMDGAGAVHAAAARALVRDGQWHHQVVTAGDFPGGVLDVPIQLNGGDETRILALWFSNPDSAYSSDVLDMDLDLAVLSPAGLVVASSADAQNPFELVRFTPFKSGTYLVRLTRQRFDGQSEPLTVAWSSRSDTATVRIELVEGPGQPTLSPGQTPQLSISEPYDGAGTFYAAWASQDPTPVPLYYGFASPTGFDDLSYVSHQMPGFKGVLGAGGTALASFALPLDPQLVGETLHFGAVLMEGAVFLAVSEPLSSVVVP